MDWWGAHETNEPHWQVDGWTTQVHPEVGCLARQDDVEGDAPRPSGATCPRCWFWVGMPWDAGVGLGREDRESVTILSEETVTWCDDVDLLIGIADELEWHGRYRYASGLRSAIQQLRLADGSRANC